jgi:anti-sigma28 factor (negative regulator of flagellin synthesis)
MTMTDTHPAAGALRALLLIIVTLVVGALGASPSPARAQAAAAARDSTHASPTRAQLEARLAQAEREAQSATSADARAEKSADVDRIRARLRDGDFQVGDRIAILIRGDTLLGDTVTVRAGRVVQLRNLPDISLQGVLHSELNSYLTKQIGLYVKHPEVQATALVHLAVLGPVGRPGFYSVPIDMTLTDLIMLAGGPGQGSNIDKTEVKRNNRVAYKASAVRTALATGMTLDQMNLRAGDQIVVGEGGRTDWLRVVQIGSIAAGMIISIYAITH